MNTFPAKWLQNDGCDVIACIFEKTKTCKTSIKSSFQNEIVEDGRCVESPHLEEVAHCLLQSHTRWLPIRAHHIIGKWSVTVKSGERVKRQSRWSAMALIWWTGGRQRLLRRVVFLWRRLTASDILVSTAVQRKWPRDTATRRSGEWLHLRRRGDGRGELRGHLRHLGPGENWTKAAGRS